MTSALFVGSHQQHSPQSSPGQGNAQHPFGTTQSQAPALSELRHRNSIAEADRVGREGLYTPSRPTSTHDRPRQHTATHERPRTNYQRRQVCFAHPPFGVSYPLLISKSLLSKLPSTCVLTMLQT